MTVSCAHPINTVGDSENSSPAMHFVVRAGDVVDGKNVTSTRPQVRAARGLARTFQHPELFTDLTVREHLVLSYRVKHARRRIWSDLVTMGSLRRSALMRSCP